MLRWMRHIVHCRAHQMNTGQATSAVAATAPVTARAVWAVLLVDMVQPR